MQPKKKNFTTKDRLSVEKNEKQSSLEKNCCLTRLTEKQNFKSFVKTKNWKIIRFDQTRYFAFIKFEKNVLLEINTKIRSNPKIFSSSTFSLRNHRKFFF